MTSTPLMHAVRRGCTNDVQLHIAYARRHGPHGITALMLAALKRDGPCLDILVDWEARMTDQDSATALMMAAAGGFTAGVRVLASKECGLQDKCGWTALMRAAHAGHQDCVLLLLQEVKKQTTEAWHTFSSGTTALMLALAVRQREIAILLSKREAGFVSSDNRTALWYALDTLQFDIAAGLCKEEMGLTPTHDLHGYTDLMQAVLLNEPQQIINLTDVARKRFRGYTALMIAAILGREECVAQLLPHENGIQNEDGQTALMLAARKGHLQCVKCLAMTEARMRDHSGATALILALSARQFSCAQHLEYVEQDIRTNAKVSPLHIAIEVGCLEIADQLKLETINRSTFMNVAITLDDDLTIIEILRIALGLSERDMQEQGLTPLMLAAAAGHYKCVRRYGKYLGQQDRNGFTALMHAVTNGNTNCISSLLPELDIANTKGQTVLDIVLERRDDACIRSFLISEVKAPLNSRMSILMLAAVAGNVKCVECYLDQACRRDANGLTALMLAAINRRTECVRILCSKESQLQTDEGETALMEAVKARAVECIELLVEREAKMQDKMGRTALMLAAVNNSPECVKLLVEQEAGLRNKWSTTALIRAAWRGNSSCVKLLLPETRIRTESEYSIKTDKGDISLRIQSTALMAAAAFGNDDCVAILVDSERQMRDLVGATALMYAAVHNHLRCVHQLSYEEGMQTSAPCSWLVEDTRYLVDRGASALMCAAAVGNLEIVEALSQREALLRDQNGWTALMYAVKYGHVECARHLIELEGKLQDEAGRTALMWAISHDQMECVRLLVAKETSIAKPWGETALMWAVFYGANQFVNLLLDEAGMQTTHHLRWMMMSTDVCTLKGTTALMLAATMDRTDCAISLLPRELKLRDESGRTALMLAAYHGSLNIIPLLREEEGLRSLEGKTAFLYALERDNLSCALELISELDFDNAFDQTLIDDALHQRNITVRVVFLPYVLENLTRNDIRFRYSKVIEATNMIVSASRKTFLITSDASNASDISESIDTLIGLLLGEYLEHNTDVLDRLEAYLTSKDVEDCDHESICSVCMSEPPDTVLLPCRHLVVCSTCAEQIGYRCPYCRNDIFEKLLVYAS
ncbi:Ankyrin repeat protein 2 [Giardia muris]|uniref:Ankyrin repeat protein 2 n=1 Tax=Giardia muris TaxID=5742 RepID=A0A4Z1SYB7_GIAMU|nr:Ankyrin repeat protein 2 [Giardia muris]|eukprot:TNJ30694.1 Ankyrin repeat protein 2 [Giardia muris]